MLADAKRVIHYTYLIADINVLIEKQKKNFVEKTTKSSFIIVTFQSQCLSKQIYPI